MRYKSDKVRKLGLKDDIFHNCTGKTFDISDPKASRLDYVKKDERSTHKYAFTYQIMMKVMKVYFKVLLDKLIEGHEIKTPIGNMELRRAKLDYKTGRDGKVYNQLNTMNYYIKLFCSGNYYKHRTVTRVILHPVWIKYIYDEVIKDPSVVYRYPEMN